jgi:hypothetical protein
MQHKPRSGIHGAMLSLNLHGFNVENKRSRRHTPWATS